jgi:hypothetical protein
MRGNSGSAHRTHPLAAGVYRHPDRVLLHPIAVSSAGVGISVPPVVRLPPDSPLEVLGSALLEVLGSAAAPIPHPDPAEWPRIRKRFLKAAGVRSWKALEEPATYCWIEDTGDEILFTPTRNGRTEGERKGFQPLPEAAVRIAARSRPGEIGAALLEALARCRPAAVLPLPSSPGRPPPANR